MANYEKEDEIKSLRQKGLTYEQISSVLRSRSNNQRGFSARSIRRFCNENNIGNQTVPDDILSAQVSAAVQKVKRLL